jgi:hypothetical protein
VKENLNPRVPSPSIAELMSNYIYINSLRNSILGEKQFPPNVSGQCSSYKMPTDITCGSIQQFLQG